MDPSQHVGRTGPADHRAESTTSWSSALARAVEDAVVLTGANGAVEFASDSVHALLGGPETFSNAWAWIDGRLRGRFEETRGPPPEGGTLDLQIPDEFGGRSVRITAFPVEDEEYAHLCIVRDRRSLEELKRNLRLALLMRQHVRFLEQAAHDIKAPLNSLALNIELLRDDLHSSEVQQATERLDVLAREIGRLDRLVHSTMSNARLPRESVRRFDLRLIAREVVSLVRPQATAQKVALRPTLPGEAVPVVGPRDHFKQAVVNLTINGLEAMPDGGTLTIEVIRHGEEAELRIQDTGEGIPEDAKPKLFQLHFTTKKDGSGLGLFTTRTTILEMGGRIEIDNRESGGTTARVRLPCAQAS